MDLLVSAAVQPDRAVIVVTHDTRVFHFADTIAHMDDGRILKTESRPHAETHGDRSSSHNGDPFTATHRNQLQFTEPVRR